MTQDAKGCDVLVVEDLRQQRLPARTLVAVLREAGLCTRLVHFGADSDPGETVALAHSEQPRLIVLSILFANLVEENLALATELRAAGVTAHVTMAGPLPTFAYASLLAACPEPVEGACPEPVEGACPALDSVLRGEAEASIVQLATGLRDAADWRAVPGLAYRSPALRTNPLPQPVPDPDALPFPAWDGGMPTYLGLGFATLEGGRGCYHACTFCLPRAFYSAGPGAPYRLRSISDLVEEMNALYRRGVRLFLFDDEQFLPPGRARQARVQALGDALERQGLDVAFTIKCRADDVDEPLFRQLQAMGLLRVYLGVESGCPASLDLLGKGVTVARNAEALALLDALGVVTDFYSLLFHPWSTLETIRAELEFLECVLPHVSTAFTFNEVELYPGTPLFERWQAEKCRPGAAEARAGEAAWRAPYAIADPAAELLRRLARVVFGARHAEGGLHDRIVQAWYSVLLLGRFGPERLAASRARALRAAVTHLNRESLALWREMLSFAAGGDLYDAGQVNERAAAWAGRANALDMMVEEELCRRIRSGDFSRSFR